MDTRNHDIDYLNRFLAELWPGIADILMADITHRVFEASRNQPGRMSRRLTNVDLSALPQIVAGADNDLTLRVPRRDDLRFRTGVSLTPWLPFPRIRVDVVFSIDVTIRSDAAPVMQVHSAVQSNAVGNAIEQVVPWKEAIEQTFSGPDIQQELGYFGAVRYAPAEVPEIPEPELMYPDRPLLNAGINLVLVPDGFSSDAFPRFDQMVEAVVRKISQPESSRANEPFHSFKSALHVWTIKPEQTPDGDHVMGSFQDPRGHQRVALANLARLAAIGRVADAAEEGPTLLVFVVNPDAPRFTGRRPSAMALGNVVLQPLQRTPEEDASLLLHELGHTSLARLGDEYVLRSRADTRYLGRPPRQANLTSDPELRTWQRWIESPSLHPDWDQHPVVGAEGGGYFGRGIWRPAASCAMRSSREGVPFCAVCREALTNGIQRLFDRQQALLQLEFDGQEPEYLMVSVTDDSATIIDIPLPVSGPIPTIVTLVAATLPEPWDTIVKLSNGDKVNRLEPGSSSVHARYSFAAVAGECLTLTLRSECPFTPWDPIPEQVIELRFVTA